MEGLIGYFILLLIVGAILFHGVLFEIRIEIACRKKKRGDCTNTNCKFIPWCHKPPRRKPRTD